MRVSERQSLWYHSVFSLLLCAGMVAILLIRHDLSAIFIVLVLTTYVGGNMLLHFRRHDFRKEAFYEYAIVATAVFVVLIGALRQ